MRPDPSRLFFLAAFLIAGLTTAITIRHATFVPWGTDSAGYVGAARRWADGDIFKPAPFQLWAPWITVGPNSMDVPLAYRAGPIRGTEVSIYPLGFPVFLAVADMIDRELGVYVVPPLFAGLLVWCTFLLGRRLAGPWAGLVAALLVATTPITLLYAVNLMSDVPAAALFFLAIEMSLRRSVTSAAAAGAAMAAAILVRPILAPMGIVPGLLTMTAGAALLLAWREWQWTRAIVFAACAAIGPLVLGWSQQVLYGGFFAPGHLGAEGFFQAKHILPNLQIYPTYIIALHTPVVFLGLLCAFVFFRRSAGGDVARLAVALCAIVFLNYGLYLPYIPYDQVWYLRFVLPAMVALFVLLSGVCVWLAALLAQRSRLLAPVAILPAVIAGGGGYWLQDDVFLQALDQRQVHLMGRYLREVLPSNAVVLTFYQGGAIAHYTGRQVLRWDLLEKHQLEPILDTLVRRGYRPVFIIDEQMERIAFKARFLDTPYERLDWRPRAIAIGGKTLSFLDFADRDGSRERSRDPLRSGIDVLK